MPTIRRAHGQKYTSISNEIAQNNSLSLRARGLILYLLSLKNDWEIHVNHLVKVMQEGRHAIRITLKELKENGYLHHQKVGFKDGWQYWLFEEPTSIDEFKNFLRTNRFSNNSNFEQFEERPVVKTNTTSKDGLREKRLTSNEVIAQSSETASEPTASPISFSFPEKKFKNIQEEDLEAWKETYPSVDVNHEILKMIQWILGNPKKAKSKKKWRLFITSWLSKNNEKNINAEARKSQSSPYAKPSRKHLDQDGNPTITGNEGGW